MKKSILFLVIMGFGYFSAISQSDVLSDVSLSSSRLNIRWMHQNDGWHIKEIFVNGKRMPHPAGYATILYLNRRPAASLVTADIEGTDFTFYPSSISRTANGGLLFTAHLRVADVYSEWVIDPDYPTDIHVKIRVKAKAKGFYSISSPTVATVAPDELKWGMIPGNWYGRDIQTDFRLATHYSQGVPAVPYLAKERNTMTLCPIITNKENISLAVIPDPGTATDPWAYDSSTRYINKLGMSLMNRHDELTPAAYSPVLGQAGSYIGEGDSLSFGFRFSLQNKDWFSVFHHAVMDIYRFPGLLQLQKNKRSLSERVRLMQFYLHDKKKSHWRTWETKGYTIGANGTKNADIGAMWMISENGYDTVMQRRLSYVRNYKLAQQRMEPGFFYGAAMGEYADEDGVASERGNYVEPLFTTYYTLIDMGNMLLFDPDDPELRRRVRLAADRLLAWQHPDGGWDVAYDRFSHKLTYPALKDLRPTWYGMLVAYRILGDKRYLQAAEKGAAWLIKNGVNKGYYLGVCGDAQNIWDFATAQCSEALLELYNITHSEAYKSAAIEAAKIYATSIFTQPIPTDDIKLVNGKPKYDWEITQTGLSVEHIQGTAGGGPILISSFTGLFIRIFEWTGDSLFLDMARSAARGRDAFVDPANGQSIYYWNGFDRVKQTVKLFPHHAYWQIGWITDYLLSEMKLRSGGKISFPAGFMTPKVGPHVCYGFASGNIFSHKADLIMPPGLLSSENPNLEYMAAISPTRDKLYLMVLNQSAQEASGTLKIDLTKVLPGQHVQWVNETVLQGRLPGTERAKGTIDLQMAAWGLNVMALDLAKQ